MPHPGNDRAAVLGLIRNPLVFFALALLAIEVVFGLVVVASAMSPDQQFVAFCIMSGLFLVVVAVVTIITIKWPQNLYEDVVRELERVEYLQEWADGPGFADAVLDIVTQHADEVFAPLARPEARTEPQDARDDSNS